MAEIFIYDHVRTPRGKGRKSGALHTVRPIDLMAQVLRATTDRTGVDSAAIEDVVVGCVTQVGEQGACIARFAALEAGYDEGVAGVTTNRFCASGLEAVHQAAARVGAGWVDLIVAGGVESMSRVAMGSDGGAIFEARAILGLGSVPQGISADLLATLRGFGRADVDAFAAESQKRAGAAVEAGAFARSVVPVLDDNGLTVLDHDEHVRADTTPDGLAGLTPSFEAMGTMFGLDTLTKERYPQVAAINHVHTAGNSSGIVDGAAAVLLGSKKAGETHGLTARAKIRAMTVVADEPVLMLTGPLPATRRVLNMAGMEIGDIDLFEVNEAFAAVPMTYMEEFGVGHERVNVHGGSIALGHPLGATGAMLLGTLVDAMEDHDKETGLVTLCVGGGMGIAAIVERTA